MKAIHNSQKQRNYVWKAVCLDKITNFKAIHNSYTHAYSAPLAFCHDSNYPIESNLELTFTSYHTAACAIASLRASKNCL